MGQAFEHEKMLFLSLGSWKSQKYVEAEKFDDKIRLEQNV